MNCKDCIHKPMCKYTEEFSNAEKKATDSLNEITKALPFKVASSLTFDCTMYQGEGKEAPASAAEKAPVKRHRRTKAEIAAANAKAIPSNESEDKIEAANKVIDDKIAKVKAESKKKEKEVKPVKEITSEEQSVKEAIEKFVDNNEKKADEVPVPTPEETFSEIKVEKEEKKTSSVEVDNEKKQNFLDLELEKILDAAISTDAKKEIVNAKINFIRDCYNTELTKGLSKEAIEWINKGLALFNMDTI